LPKEDGVKTISLVTRVVLLVIMATAGLMTSEVMAQSSGHTGNPAPTVQAWRPYGAKKSKTPSSTSQVRSESTARALSLWSTVIPTVAGMVVGGHDKHVTGGALLITGMIVGPSTGYFYGNCPGRGAQGILLRACTAGATVGLTAYLARDTDTGDFGDNIANAVLAIGVGGMGVGVLIYEAIHDISHVKSEVRMHNAGISSMSLRVAPKFFAQSKALGLELRAAL
jgi:hypothetical protein